MGRGSWAPHTSAWLRLGKSSTVQHPTPEFKSIVNINGVVGREGRGGCLFHWRSDCSHCPHRKGITGKRCWVNVGLSPPPDETGRAPPCWGWRSWDHAVPTEGMLLPARLCLPLHLHIPLLRLQMNPCALCYAGNIAWHFFCFVFWRGGRVIAPESPHVCRAELYRARRLRPQCRTRCRLETHGASEDLRHNCDCLSKTKENPSFASSGFSGGAFFCHTLRSCESVLGPPRSTTDWVTVVAAKRGQNIPRKWFCSRRTRRK